MAERIRVEGDNITLSKLIWRRNLRRVEGVAEAALDLNPSIASLGAVLPFGTIVYLPAPKPTSRRPVISLYD